jgi:hypothetical protein
VFFGHALRFYHGDVLAIQLGLPQPATQIFANEVPLVYPPLDKTVDSLRLLHLIPSSAHGVINCTLESIHFSSKPTYDALSYAWGEGNETERIQVNGASVEITESLWNALYYLRHTKEMRTLWVDAICIDQSNVEERSRQVPLMDFIYGRAQTVLVR